MSKSMILKPRVSEKAYGVSETSNTYVFQVPTDANKTTIADAVSAQFDVTVETVNVMNVKGKVKRTVRRGGKASIGKRVDIKKAYVTLKEGDSIVIFKAEDESNEAPKKGKK